MPVETASDPLFDPMRRTMNKMLDQLQKGFYNFCPSETWKPSVNLYETDTSYLVCVDLAGVVKNDIELTMVEQVLTLRGTRVVPSRAPAAAEDASQPRYRVHLMEIDHGTFSREVELPENVNKDKIQASYIDGMLWVELPKK